jgi:hypothetical protein
MTGRITTEPGFLDLVDVLTAGGTAEWQDLYQRAKRDAALRAEIREALRMVDPEIGAARQMWTLLLNRIEAAEPPGRPHHRVARQGDDMVGAGEWTEGSG